LLGNNISGGIAVDSEVIKRLKQPQYSFGLAVSSV